MIFRKEYLDLVLVPTGLLLMFGYHLFLLYRYLHLPHTTIFGFENNDKKYWVDKVMKARLLLPLLSSHGLELLEHWECDECQGSRLGMERKDNALSVLNSNISAATYLASISLTLSSLIGAWIANNSNIFESELIYGDTRPSTMSIKYISLLICFILAFSCFVQSARSFIHANYLLSIPNSNIPTKYVELIVIRGGDFWALALRALYFAINLLLWFFGPIPMFASSVAMVLLLHYLDSNTTPMSQHRQEGKQSVGL
ncbi:hypothetical protein Acr_00g0011140 [Actinidia rufa]|uniref:Transmembrane protein n=1 Tax=Actinidia rufa TaxID=165716 RepID=A0A7J0D9C4_9ERIC|nr:hypothetical protein Acr_00g0011140 [Actinidia rufa]